MGSSIFSIGLTGLNAAQAGLATTSHNIANAGTAGYSRQSVIQTTNGGTQMGNVYFGEGTNVQAVQRAYNGFLNEQVLAADSPWWPLREQVQARARASQDKPTPASEFAAELLKAVQRKGFDVLMLPRPAPKQGIAMMPPRELGMCTVVGM